MNTAADHFDFYINRVFPQVAADLKRSVFERYPRVRLQAEAGFTPLPSIPVTMLVALTATGKSTTLEQLVNMRGDGLVRFSDDLPTRREIADLVIIPTAQVIGGEAVQSVSGREERFACTRRFAEAFEPGGSAAVYRWLHYQWDGKTPILSDGVRGPGEIRYTLEYTSAWHIIELWVDPLVRLRRLTNRSDAFDQIANLNRESDLSFLPEDLRAAALRLLQTGEISLKSVITARAEAQNYGSHPYDASNQTTGYFCLNMREMNPEEVARVIIQRMGQGHVSG